MCPIIGEGAVIFQCLADDFGFGIDISIHTIDINIHACAVDLY